MKTNNLFEIREIVMYSVGYTHVLKQSATRDTSHVAPKQKIIEKNC